MAIILRNHQRQAVEIMRDRPRLYLNHDCGTGKTITCLAHCADVPMPTLVIAPKSVMRTAWGGDAEHFPGLSLAFAHGGKAAVRKAIDAAPDVLVTTFDTFRLYSGGLIEGRRRLIVDEASKVKNHESQTARSIMLASRKAERVYLLSGTPAPNCPSEWFAQMFCVDPRILGERYWGMVNRWFIVRKKHIKGRDVVDRLEQTPQQREAFAALIAPHVHQARKSECLDLPAVSDVVVRVELSRDERTAYERLEDALVLTLEDGNVDRIKAEAALTKLRQCTGGAYYHEGRSVPIGTSKLDALSELLEEIGPREPVVIWAEYRSEIDRICQAFGGVHLDGRTSHEAERIVADFQAGRTPRLVCHPQAAGHGITLTRACYAIYFSLSFSLELFEQSRARLDRSGQTRPVTNYILCSDETIDRAIWRVIQSKGNVQREVLNAIREGRSIESVRG